jgi:hypothetical protein
MKFIHGDGLHTHIIITCKTAVPEPRPSLEDSVRLHPVFAAFLFATIQVTSLGSNSQPEGPGPRIYVRQ